MEACADMECCLKVHSKCESCMMKTIDVLRSICGVYSVCWDAQQNVFKICGEVDPNILLGAVLRTGEHAELLTVKLNHPQLRLKNYSYGHPSYSYGPLAGHTYYGTSDQYPPYREPTAAIEYLPSYTNDYQNPLTRATYVPSYPPQEYDPNDKYEGLSYCSIM